MVWPLSKLDKNVRKTFLPPVGHFTINNLAVFSVNQFRIIEINGLVTLNEVKYGSYQGLVINVISVSS